ncbi:MAG: TetR/AcrR family transcriptional regulator [Planctomycetaceae bacterium]|nr:TetR/AcrR family transcriptional regulator [Planctomycetaceae bacterium]
MAGRPKSYDDAQVLSQAMRTFWKQGYEATSYSDLEKSTGLGRQSLYGAFGDKKCLFVAALKHYGQNVTQLSLEILNQDGSPISNVGRWLRRLVERAARLKIGCLLTNTAIEAGTHDADVQQVVQQELACVEQALQRTLRRAVACGELSPQTNVSEVATYFFGVAQGLMVMGRMGQSRIRLTRFANVALATLQPAAN